MEKLPESFYTRTNVVQIAKELLGKKLVTNIDGHLTSGIITETEAYAGINDRASHAFGGRRTNRTEPMFGQGGIAYVYLCYGIHHLLNIVTGVAGHPHAVLIRGLEPVDGLETMLYRRNKINLNPALTAGPGSASEALGVTVGLSGISLQGPEIWIEHAPRLKSTQITAGTRVGVAYAREDALLLYRFWIKDNPYVSRAKGL